MADSRITFDVRLDSSKFDSSVKSLGDGFKGTKRSIEELSKISESAFGSSNQNRVDALTKKYAQQASAIEKSKSRLEELKRQLDDVNNTKNDKLMSTQEKYTAQVEKLTEKLTLMKDRMDKLQSGEVKPKDLVSMEEELDSLIRKIDSMQAKKDKLVASNAANTSWLAAANERQDPAVIESRQYKDISASVAAMNSQIETANESIRTMTDSWYRTNNQVSAIRSNIGSSTEVQRLAGDIRIAETAMRNLTGETRATKQNIESTANSKSDKLANQIKIEENNSNKLNMELEITDRNLAEIERDPGSRFNAIDRLRDSLKSLKRPLSETNRSVNRAVTNLNRAADSAVRSLTRIAGAIFSIALIKDSTKMAMAVESNMNNIGRNLGQSAQAYQDWVEEQAKAYGISTANAYEYGANYSNLLSGFIEDTELASAKTIELTEATAVIASKTGRTFEDAAQRIRSGLLGNTEAIDDLGIFTQTAMLESTEAFRKFAGDKSWGQLDFKTQQQIRLIAILEQSYDKYGDTMAKTTQSTHNEFLASLGNIRSALGDIVKTIYNIILPTLIKVADIITEVLENIGAALRSITGQTKKSAADASNKLGQLASNTSGLEDLTGSMDDLGESAKEAQKSMQGFDQLNILQDQEAPELKVPELNTTPKIEYELKPAPMDNNFKEGLRRLQDMFKPTIKALGRFWDKALKPFLKFLTDNLKLLYDKALVPLGKWMLGEKGLPRLLNILADGFANVDWAKLNRNFGRFYEVALLPLSKFVWTGLLNFLENFLVPVAQWVLGEGLPNLLRVLSDFAEKINWERILDSLDRLWESLAPFAIQVGEGLLWLLEYVLQPLALWALNDFIPVMFELIAAAIDALGALIDANSEYFLWLFENFLTPLANWVGDLVIKMLEGLTEALRKFSEWAANNKGTVETMTSIIIGFLGGLYLYYKTYKIIQAVDKMRGAIVKFLAAGGLEAGIAGVKFGIFLGAMSGIVNLVSRISRVWDVLSQGEQILATLGTAAMIAAVAVAMFHSSWSVGAAALAIAGGIGIIMNEFLKTKEMTGDIGQSSVSTANFSESRLRRSEGRNYAMPGQATSFMSTVKSGHGLPKLAKGGLIPPRKPRQVIVGDNMVEDEIVSPVSTMEKAMSDVLARSGGVGGSNDEMVQIMRAILAELKKGHVIEMDNRELGKTIVNTVNNARVQTGRQLI